MNHPIEFGHVVSYQICYDMNHPIQIRPLIAIIKMNFCGLTELYSIAASDEMLHSDLLKSDGHLTCYEQRPQQQWN